MKLYNTLSRQVEDFEPIDAKTVKLYTCGPTVYHYAHIGNLRNVIFNDTLRRTLEFSGYPVNHVMNITDVGHLVSDADEGQDKLEKGAAREGKTVWEVAQFYIDAFNQHTAALHVLPPTKTIRATDAIGVQIEMVEILLEKGFAYLTEQAVYFDVAKLEDYGKLSGQKLADKEVGVRSEVITDKDKHHPQDFALWFFTVGHFADHQMRWTSPWGEGFPGWHLECSAIIHQSLGETIDIHTGGVDHIGTHHTNEIAQSEAAFGKPLARFWLHNEFLQQDGGGKMSKSGSETITLDEVIKRGYDPLALRLFYLQSHYRSQANFSWENLEAAQNRLKAYRAMADLRWQGTQEGVQHTYYDTYTLNLKKSLENDLNTPMALETISAVSDDLDETVLPENNREFIIFLSAIDKLFGLNLLKSKDITQEQKRLIADRSTARANQDWPKSDDFRDQLIEQGIGLRDTENGAVWYRL